MPAIPVPAIPVVDRRRFLAGLAGAALLNAQPKPYRIDVHHHLFPPEYRAAIDAMHIANLAPWTVQQSLDEMGKGAIETALLSVSTPGVWFGDTMQARKLARVVNDYGAKLAGDYRGKFGLFAALPLPDTEGSLREIEYVLDTLKAPGIGLMTSYQISGAGDRWLGDAAFAPVWEELNRRKAVVYTHPDTPGCCANLKDELGPGTIEWATATSRTMASLLFSGTAAKYPNIRWIFSHGGGTVPFLLSRFLRQETEMKERQAKLPNGVLYELKKFYYDTAQANHPGALAALLKLAPVSQILYGTDYPYRTAAEEGDGLTAQHFRAQDIRAIEAGNAKRLLF
jgi:predicted TIM-barrel fold metal-dependent hydrolase